MYSCFLTSSLCKQFVLAASVPQCTKFIQLAPVRTKFEKLWILQLAATLQAHLLYTSVETIVFIFDWNFMDYFFGGNFIFIGNHTNNRSVMLKYPSTAQFSLKSVFYNTMADCIYKRHICGLPHFSTSDSFRFWRIWRIIWFLKCLKGKVGLHK